MPKKSAVRRYAEAKNYPAPTKESVRSRIYVQQVGQDSTIGPGHWRPPKPIMGEKRAAQWRANSRAKKDKWK